MAENNLPPPGQSTPQHEQRQVLPSISSYQAHEHEHQHILPVTDSHNKHTPNQNEFHPSRPMNKPEYSQSNQEEHLQQSISHNLSYQQFPTTQGRLPTEAPLVNRLQSSSSPVSGQSISQLSRYGSPKYNLSQGYSASAPPLPLPPQHSQPNQPQHYSPSSYRSLPSSHYQPPYQGQNSSDITLTPQQLPLPVPLPPPPAPFHHSHNQHTPNTAIKASMPYYPGLHYPPYMERQSSSPVYRIGQQQDQQQQQMVPTYQPHYMQAQQRLISSHHSDSLRPPLPPPSPPPPPYHDQMAHEYRRISHPSGPGRQGRLFSDLQLNKSADNIVPTATATAIPNAIQSLKSNQSLENQAERKRFHSDPTHSRSSIAGAVYNSGAVYKRLKIADYNAVPGSTQSGGRPQGRPFSSDINCRFFLHDHMFALIQYVDKRDSKEMLVYDFTKLSDNSVKESVKEEDCSADSHNIHSTYAASVTGSTIAAKCGELDVDFFKGDSGIEDLDRCLGSKNIGTTVLDSRTFQFKEPLQRVISHKPGLVGYKRPALASSHCGAEEAKKSSSLEFLLNNTNVGTGSERNKKSSGDDELSVNNDSIPEGEEAGTDSTSNDLNIHNLIKKNFGINQYRFVKIIRDNNGKVLKLETIKPPSSYSGQFMGVNAAKQEDERHPVDDENSSASSSSSTEAEEGSGKKKKKEYCYTSEWIKKTVCYPRYKSKMKIHLVKSNANFILYNDLKMMLWDISEEYKNNINSGQKSMIMDQLVDESKKKASKEELPFACGGSSGTIIDQRVKVTLFKSKKVYIKLST